MVAERLDVRLDPERRTKLAQLAETRNEAISDMVRRLIDEEHERLLDEQRRRAAEDLCNLEVEDTMPAPEEMRRQSASTYGKSDLY